MRRACNEEVLRRSRVLAMMLFLLPLLVLGEQAEFAGLRKGQAAVCVVEWAGRGMAVCMWCVWECETLAMNKPERETDDAGSSRRFACVVPEMWTL
jgi:hypothetical protein